MLQLTKDQLLKKLPQREFWFTRDIADALEVGGRAVQYAASTKGIGRKVRSGNYGVYIFLEEDLQKLIDNLHGRVGRPPKK